MMLWRGPSASEMGQGLRLVLKVCCVDLPIHSRHPFALRRDRDFRPQDLGAVAYGWCILYFCKMATQCFLVWIGDQNKGSFKTGNSNFLIVGRLSRANGATKT